MKFIDTIVERDDLFLKEVRCLKTKYPDVPLYIWGGGVRGNYTKQRLIENGLTFDGIIESRKYHKEGSSNLILEDTLSGDVKANIIVAFCGYKPEMLAEYKEHVDNIIYKDTVTCLRYSDDEFITYDWVENHEKELQDLYDMLEDEHSKKTMSAYINQKISADMKYLSSVKVANQYFMDDLIKFGKREVFVDCGAYTGDSAQSFVDALHRQGMNNYDRIISFEPEKSFLEVMKARKLQNHICLEKGVSDAQKTLRFTTENLGSRLDDNGEVVIEIDTIDNILQGAPATYIKMDIEGEELPSLKGAKQTISDHKPKLAICIYHKAVDLLTIPQYIRSLNPDYKFYMRAHEDYANEIVLYVV